VSECGFAFKGSWPTLRQPCRRDVRAGTVAQLRSLRKRYGRKATLYCTIMIALLQDRTASSVEQSGRKATLTLPADGTRRAAGHAADHAGHVLLVAEPALKRDLRQR
jgi:hypothetical protein